MVNFRRCPLCNSQLVEGIKVLPQVPRSMAFSLYHHKKRKSFLTVTRRNSTLNDLSLTDLPSYHQLAFQSEWKSLMLNTSRIHLGPHHQPSQQSFKKNNNCNKENVHTNRPIIKIKPKKHIGSCHLLWCQPNARSELIRLQRQDPTNFDQE